MNKKGKYEKYKSIPKGSKRPKQLCIKCFKYIHKNDINYDLKICKACEVPYRASLGLPGKASFAQASDTFGVLKKTIIKKGDAMKLDKNLADVIVFITLCVFVYFMTKGV